jgi:hypothetical protein
MGGAASIARKQRVVEKALLRTAAKTAEKEDRAHAHAESAEAVEAVCAAAGGLIELKSGTFGGWTWAYVAMVTRLPVGGEKVKGAGASGGQGEDEQNGGSAPTVEVNSDTLHGWTTVELRYGQRTKVLQLRPGWSSQLRNPLPLKAMAEVNSESFGGWVPASLIAATEKEAALQYGERTKIVRLGDPANDPRVFIRRPTPAKERHMCAPPPACPHILSPPPPPRARWGCVSTAWWLCFCGLVSLRSCPVCDELTS